MFSALIFHKGINAIITWAVVVFTSWVEVLIGSKFKNPKNNGKSRWGQCTYFSHILILSVRSNSQWFVFAVVKFSNRHDSSKFVNLVRSQKDDLLTISSGSDIFLWIILFSDGKFSMTDAMELSALTKEDKMRLLKYLFYPHHRRHRKYLLMRLSSVRLWISFLSFIHYWACVDKKVNQGVPWSQGIFLSQL